MPRAASYTLAAVSASLAIAPCPARAGSQITYGPWQKTADCRSARSPSGVRRDKIVLPQAPGGAQAQECRWVREVLDCPRLRDKVFHPRQCLTREDRPKGYSIQPPSSHNRLPHLPLVLRSEAA